MPLGFWEGLRFPPAQSPVRTSGSVHSTQASHPCHSDATPNASPLLTQASCSFSHSLLAWLSPHSALSMAPLAPDEWASESSDDGGQESLHLLTEQFLPLPSYWCLTTWSKSHKPVVFSRVSGGCSSIFIFPVSELGSENGMRKKRSEVRGEVAFQILFVFSTVWATIMGLNHLLLDLVTLSF